jgi:hypothetical protein
MVFNTLFLGDINTGTWPSRLGSLKIETINMVLSPAGLRPDKDSAGDAQQQLKTTDPTSRQRGGPTSTNYRPDLSLERALHINKPATV